jgi:hypothetical protein
MGIYDFINNNAAQFGREAMILVSKRHLLPANSQSVT